MDPIADMISIINNAQAIGKKQIVIFPYSNFKFEILELLKQEGFLGDVQKKGRLANKKIVVDLKYNEDNKPTITKIKKVSKQGQRIYVPASKIKPVRSGYGISIISTSHGLMTIKKTKNKKSEEKLFVNYGKY